MKERLRMVLVGCGEQATNMLHPAVSHMDEVEVVGCCDLDEQSAARTARRYGLPRYWTDVDTMLRECEADAALIAAFPAAHAQIAVKCLEAGLHLFLEKPLGMNLKEADEVEAAAEKSGMQVRLGFMKRYAPSYTQLKRIIDSDEFGEPSLFVGKQGGGYRPSSSDLLRVGSIHMFDCSRYLIGEPNSLYATKYEKTDGQVSFSVNVTFDNGCVGSYILTSLNTWMAPRMSWVEVTGDQNTVWVQDMRDWEWWKPPLASQKVEMLQRVREVPSPGAIGRVNTTNITQFENQGFYRHGYFQVIHSFVKAILANEPAGAPDIRDGRRALEMAIAVEESAKSGKIVDLSRPQ